MELLETAYSFFQSIQWPVSYLEHSTALTMEYPGRHGRWMCHLHLLEASDQVIFYSIFPASVPEDRRMAMTEFLCRANYGIILGNFEMNLLDGELRYKTSIDVEGSGLSHALLKPLVFGNVTMLDRYFDSLVGIIDQGISSEDALSLVER